MSDALHDDRLKIPLETIENGMHSFLYKAKNNSHKLIYFEVDEKITTFSSSLHSKH